MMPSSIDFFPFFLSKSGRKVTVGEVLCKFCCPCKPNFSFALQHYVDIPTVLMSSNNPAVMGASNNHFSVSILQKIQGPMNLKKMQES